MKPLFFSLCLAALSGVSACNANAQGFGGNGNLGFLPFGFYQPYGAQYGTSLRTPPYFATNPPVYYGTRYARPYGLSPFAAPPMLNAPASYVGREAAQFVRPPMSNPYLIESSCVDCVGENPTGAASSVAGNQSPIKAGIVRANPFVADDSRVATR
jgi:hypothetical protein